MVDVVDNKTRSRMMAAVRTKDTLPEVRVRKHLHAAGFRYRLHARELPGVPDIVLPRFRTVIFVHGCFWHQHPNCPKAKLPASNCAFWNEKLSGNVKRDQRVWETLHGLGWCVLVVWECETRDLAQLGKIVEQIRQSPGKSGSALNQDLSDDDLS